MAKNSDSCSLQSAISQVQSPKCNLQSAFNESLVGAGKVELGNGAKSIAEKW